MLSDTYHSKRAGQHPGRPRHAPRERASYENTPPGEEDGMAWQHGNMATTKQRSQSVLWIGHRSLVLPRCLPLSQPAGRRRAVRTDESTSRRQTPAQPANVAAARHPPLWFFCSSLRPSHASELPCPCCTVLNDTAPYLHGYEIRYTTYAIVSLPGTVLYTSASRHPAARRRRR